MREEKRVYLTQIFFPFGSGKEKIPKLSCCRKILERQSKPLSPIYRKLSWMRLVLN